MSCKDQECKVLHCVSSRYVLSHYSKCKEPTCPVCGPVREAIKRNYERSRNGVKMARNPNQPHNGVMLSGMSGPLTQALGMSVHHAPELDQPPAKRTKKGRARLKARREEEGGGGGGAACCLRT